MWNHPKTLSIISDIAGVDLVPQMNFEIGHVNLSVKSEQETKAELDLIERETRGYAADEGIAGCPWEDDKPVVGWHTDSYPFVCVLMLSDCTDMVGGETALRTGNGDILKVRGPQMVSSAMRLKQRRIPTLTNVGMCGRDARKVYHSPSPTRPWCKGTNHHGHVVSTKVTSFERRLRVDHRTWHLRP